MPLSTHVKPFSKYVLPRHNIDGIYLQEAIMEEDSIYRSCQEKQLFLHEWNNIYLPAFKE